MGEEMELGEPLTFEGDLLDDVPPLQSWCAAVKVNLPMRDDKAFRTVFGVTFENDLESADGIQALVDEGTTLIQVLYSLRGCDRALPIVSNPDQEDKHEIYMNTYKVLRPQIEPLIRLCGFKHRAIGVLSTTIKKLGAPEQARQVVPDILSDAIINLIDVLIKLDHIKDMKASLQNDFSFFKRAFTLVQDEVSDAREVSAGIQLVQALLSDPTYPKSYLFHTVKDAIQTNIGFDDVVQHLLKFCTRCINSGLYVLSDGSFQYVRVMAHLMIMLDANNDKKEMKKLKLDSAFKILRRFPTVPVYADMSLKIAQVLSKSDYFSSMLKEQKTVDSTANWQKMRKESTDYLAKLATAQNSARVVAGDQSPRDAELARSIYDTVVEGFRLLNSWKAGLLEQLADKYQNPVPFDVAEELGANLENPGIEYERVLRYNYSPKELSYVVDTISIVKTVSNTLRNAEASLAYSLRINIYLEVQKFCQHTMLPIFRRADKKHKVVMKGISELRSMGADWISNEELNEDYKARRNKKAPPHLEPRCVAASSTQLALIRATTQALYDEKASGMRSTGLFSRKDFDSSEVSAMDSFFTRSFFYPYVLSMASTAEDLSDFSDLWCREFYLELTKCVQFPIEMSLPWMLVEHVTANPTTNLTESIIHMMDIYNDTSNRALRCFKQQFLFDEIEAEVNLCFDQLVFLVSDQIYGVYKNLSACQVLDKSYKRRLQGVRAGEEFVTDKGRYEVLMSQRHVQVLGSYIDLSDLISKHINSKLIQDVENAMQRFEGSADISGVLEFELLISVIKGTHEKLSQFLSLDSMSAIIHDINDSAGTVENSISRIATHILNKLLNDIIPNFAYNYFTQRFLRAPICLGEAPPKEQLPRSIPENLLFGSQCRNAYDILNRLSKGFFGLVHVEAILRLLSAHEVATLVTETLKVIEENMTNVLNVCVVPLGLAIPPCKLPKFMYKFGGSYAYFESKLHTIIEYGERPQVFQAFREIGNVIALMELLQCSLSVKNTFATTLARPFLGLSPSLMPESPETNYDTSIFNVVMSKVAKIIEDSDLKYFQEFVEESETEARNAYSVCRRDFLGLALRHIDQLLDKLNLRETWAELKDPLSDRDEPNSEGTFATLWSALQYVYCIAPVAASNGMPRPIVEREEYGDGFIIAGCAFVHLLNQTARFQLLDFTRHTTYANEYDHSSGYGDPTRKQRRILRPVDFVGNIDRITKEQANRYYESAPTVVQLNEHIFSTMLNSNGPPRGLPSPSKNSYTPPTAQQILQQATAANTLGS